MRKSHLSVILLAAVINCGCTPAPTDEYVRERIVRTINSNAVFDNRGARAETSQTFSFPLFIEKALNTLHNQPDKDDPAVSAQSLCQGYLAEVKAARQPYGVNEALLKGNLARLSDAKRMATEITYQVGPKSMAEIFNFNAPANMAKGFNLQTTCIYEVNHAEVEKLPGVLTLQISSGDDGRPQQIFGTRKDRSILNVQYQLSDQGTLNGQKYVYVDWSADVEDWPIDLQHWLQSPKPNVQRLAHRTTLLFDPADKVWR